MVNVTGATGFTAVVSRIEPSAFTKVSPLGVEEQRVNVIAALDTAPVGLGDRFRVSTSIVLWSAESA
jgi:HlyD family secretion protein